MKVKFQDKFKDYVKFKLNVKVKLRFFCNVKVKVLVNIMVISKASLRLE